MVRGGQPCSARYESSDNRLGSHTGTNSSEATCLTSEELAIIIHDDQDV